MFAGGKAKNVVSGCCQDRITFAVKDSVAKCLYPGSARLFCTCGEVFFYPGSARQFCTYRITSAPTP